MGGRNGEGRRGRVGPDEVLTLSRHVPNRKSAGLATGAACVGLVSVGVPSAAVYFLGAEHPLVQAVLTVLGRVPKG